MSKLAICRICLIENVRMHSLLNTNLQETYELLTGTMFNTKDNRPSQVCYVCCARLRNCYQMRTACVRSEELLTQMLQNSRYKPTQLQYMKPLTLVRPPKIWLSMDTGTFKDLNVDVSVNELTEVLLPNLDDVPIKEEHDEVLEDTVVNPEATIQFTEQEDIKAEDVSSEDDDMSDYCIKAEAYSDNDVSSQDMEDIICRKPAKIVLHRLHVKELRKSVTVFKKRRIIDLKESASSTSARIFENELTFKPNKNIDIKHNSITANLRETTSIDAHHSAKQYKCDICGKCFKVKAILSTHIRTHTGEKPYRCSYCAKCFIQKSDLTRHIRTHTGEKPHECNTCGKCFGDRSNLLIHMRTHTGERPYKCSACEKCFSQKGALTRHILTHTGERPYKCSACEKCFSLRGDLTRHIFIHTGKRPYRCSSCGKCFRDKSSLLIHIRTHTGERPYKCSACVKCFNQNSELIRHIRTHTGEKPYKCSSCEKCFIEKNRLLIHIRTHTGDRPYKCSSCEKCFKLKGYLRKHSHTHR